MKTTRRHPKSQAEYNTDFVFQNLFHAETRQSDEANRIRQQNAKAGLNLTLDFVEYQETLTEDKKRKWVNSTTINQTRNKKFIDEKYLVTASLVPEDFRAPHEVYPYIQLNNAYRYKLADQSEWLVESFTLIGLNQLGEEKQIVMKIGFYNPPRVMYELVPENPDRPNSAKIRVGKISSNNKQNPIATSANPAKFTQPFDPKIFQEHVERFGNGRVLGTNDRNAIHLLFVKNGMSNSLGVTYDEFIVPNVDEIIEEKTRPTIGIPGFKIDPGLLQELQNKQHQLYG